MRKLTVSVLIWVGISISWAQTSINPDISAIGTFNTFTNFIKDTPEYGKLNFDTPDFELFVDS